MQNSQRPLSPHLQVYKPQLSSVLSITHRATGVFLSIGSAFLALWLLALASGGEAWACAEAISGSWFGILCLAGWSYALFFHLCNGIRHMVWDTGRNLEMDSANKSGIFVVLASLILTAAVWAAACL